MIATFIVLSSLLLAAIFIVAWLLKPDFRRRIEAPKYAFQQQLDRYNQEYQTTDQAIAGGSDESS
jgi:hypothetical protein